MFITKKNFFLPLHRYILIGSKRSKIGSKKGSYALRAGQ